MKNAASCETWCELQDTLSTDLSNAHCGPGFLPGPRLSEGRMHKTVRRGVREDLPPDLLVFAGKGGRAK